MKRKHQHHEISDATVVAVMITLGIAVFGFVLAVVLLPYTTFPAKAEPSPEPGVEVSVVIEPKPLAWDEQSPCWHPPYLPQYPHWTQCIYRTNA